MSLAHRLTIVSSDIDGNELDVKVYLEGYAGSPVTRFGTGAPLEIIAGASEGELLPIVYGTQATVRFLCENDYEFFDLFVSNARDCYVEILLNTTQTLFKGFIDPGKWSEPLTAPGYEVEFTAFDGLGLLKDEDFKDTGKTYYEGWQTPLDILSAILEKTGLELPLNTKVNIRPAGALTTADALTQVTKDLVTYRDMSCYDVLTALFKNCRIFQRGGEWNIISNDNWVETSITAFHYTSTGVADGTKAITLRISDFWYENEPMLSLVSAIKQITVKQDFGLKANIIENPDFTDYEAGNFDGWTPLGVTVPEQRAYDDKGNKYVYLPGTEYKASWTDPRSYGIFSNGYAVKATANIPRISVDYATIGLAGKAANIFVGIKLVTSTTAYCVIANLLEDNKTIEYIWDERATIQPLGCPPQVTHNKHWGTPDSYFIDKAPVSTYPADEVADHFATQVFTLKEGIPADGTLYIYLYTPNTNAPSNVFGSCFRAVSIRFTDETDGELATGTEVIIENNPGNNYVPEDLKIINGDVPDIENDTVIYAGAFKLNDGSENSTTAWELDGNAAQYTWAEMMARLMANELRAVKQSVNGRVADVALGAPMVFEDPNNTGHLFVECGVTYDFRMKTLEGRFIEVTEADPTGFTLFTKTDYKKTDSNGSTSSTPAVVLSTDEKVGMITPLFEIVNVPGHLSTDDFVQEIDETTGRALIRTRANVQAGRLTGLASRTVTVTFRQAFDEIPVGLPRAYRMVADGGVYLMQDVLFSYPTESWLTETGFTITIDTAEELTGIIILYDFTESNYTA